MTEFEVENALAMSAEAAWAALSDPAVYERMYLQGLDFETCEVEVLDEAPIFRMRTVTTPRVKLPGPIQKVIGDKSSYTESIEWDRAAGVWKWNIKLAATDRVSISGRMTLRADGEARCFRHNSIRVEAKIFGIGGLMEKTIRDQVRDNYDKSARFLNAL